MMNQKKDKKETEPKVETKTLLGLQLYSICIIIIMIIFGRMTIDTISTMNTDKETDIESIIEVDSKKELNKVTSKKGKYEVMISGKVTSYGPIHDNFIGKSLLYLKSKDIDDKTKKALGDEKVERSEFLSIYDMNFSSNTFLFMDTVINTTRIENGIRTEYEAIPINTECVIHGHIENGKLLIGAKLYTSKTIDELKSELEATSSPSSFAVLWVILTIVIAYAPTVYIANKSYKNNIVDISKTCKLKELEMTRIIDTYEPNVKKYRKITNEVNKYRDNTRGKINESKKYHKKNK